MGAREYISETVRAAVFHSDNGKCYHCSKKLVYNNRTNRLRGAWHIEHLVAHSKGGSDSLNNLRAACIDCNLKKSNKSVSEWNRQDGYAGSIGFAFIGAADRTCID
ncbi:hypothetical protein BC832DRAFT_541444 [Gaertneriomyces semiglobifer]|nr:hypothetical protein BC832DRAFT_541444 [Gaertneriomyces semiglobifer]